MTKLPLPDAVVGLAPQAIPAAPYMTDPEFCAFYRVPPRTAMRWRKEGGGPPFVRLGPRQIRYRFVDTEAWASTRTFRDRTAEQSAQQAHQQAA